MRFLRSRERFRICLVAVALAAGCAEKPAPAGAASAEAARAASATAASSGAPSAGGAAPDQPPSSGRGAKSGDAAPAGLPAVVGSVDLPALRVAPSLRPDGGGVDALREIFAGYGFPGAPGLTHLCGQRVYQPGAGGHLTWDALASEEAPATLIERYRARLGEKGFEAVGEGGRWRLPPGAPVPQRSLEILAPSAQGPHRTCDKEPPVTTQSVLVLSREG